MNFIIDFARSEGYKQVRLFVIDTNERAKTFYERIGFSHKGMQMLLFPWNRILGFNGAHEMVYTIT
jgi:ribosomal protein S18 acetylase RimI-like enzyme